jgi:hypothetical protein
MAEVKNAFIQSKMNKDLDDRLLPSGQYRHAINAQVSKSEGPDVGALENVLGNALVVDLTNSVENVSSIGYLSDEFSNIIYVFLTDNSSSSYIPSGPGSNHFIYKYNAGNNSFTKLVEGAFLNFSKLSPIFGVNLLEDLLFWTDNRNQPRKINVKNSLGYYTKEDQISVAKYYPYKAIDLYSESELVPTEYESTMKDVVSKNLPNGGSAFCSAVTSSSTFSINNLSIQVYPNEPLNGFSIGYIDSNGDIITLNESVDSYNSGTSELTLTGPVDIPLIGGSTELVLNVNPYYENKYPGDEKFLEDKFVRFSYRFKFDDGEYSLLAPFTQVCFIPKQDGYFLNTTEKGGDEKQAIESTIVQFAENKVNKINLQIPLPCNGINLLNEYHITEIDIIYKESDGLALQVVESVPVDTITTNVELFEYIYTSQKPYKTLPSNEITRVYDKVPVKALAQEIISNRVVYGNYLDKIDPPAFLNYNIAATEKYDFNLGNNFTSVVEYPNSSLKTNRNYQVGVVLADKFGRQSTVILSNNKETITVGGISYSGSTLYSPYISQGIDEDAWRGNSLKILFNNTISQNIYNGNVSSFGYNPTGWYSYKIVVKQTEQDYYNVYTAGALKGDPEGSGNNLSTSYISLYSDNINKVPRDLSEVGPTQKQFRSSIRLFGRVENTAIAQSNTGNQQYFPGKVSFSTSSIQDLFDTFDYRDPASISEADDIFVIYNATSNPLVGQITTSQNTLLQFGTTNPVPADPPTDPPQTYQTLSNLTILETNPNTSRLDIFWETSTSGTIEELNAAINQENPSAGGFSSFDTDLFDEGIEFGEDILTTDFYLVDFFGATIPVGDIDSFELTSVLTTDSTPQPVDNYFELYEPTPGSKNYNIRVTSAFLANVYYGSQSSKRVWNFNFTAVVNGSSSIIPKTVSLINLPPVMYVTTYTPAEDFSVTKEPSDSLIATLKATNGASIVDFDNLNTGKDLSWSIQSQTNSSGISGSYFTTSVSSTDLISTCELQNNQVGTITPDAYTVVLRVTDGGSSTYEITITVQMGVVILPGQVTNVEIRITQEEQYGYIFDDIDYVFFIEVTESGITEQNGLYMYSQSWGNGGAGGNLIAIDYTNAVNLQSSCPNSSAFWAFTNDPQINKIDMVNDFIYCYYTNILSISYTETVVDTTNNTFVIV